MKKVLATLIWIFVLIGGINTALAGEIATYSTLIGALYGTVKDGKPLKGAATGALVGLMAEVLGGFKIFADYPYYYQPYYLYYYQPYYQPYYQSYYQSYYYPYYYQPYYESYYYSYYQPYYPYYPW